MGLFKSTYVKAKEQGLTYSKLETKSLLSSGDFFVNGYLAFDEILEELSTVKRKNQELEAKLDRVIQLLENK